MPPRHPSSPPRWELVRDKPPVVEHAQGLGMSEWAFSRLFKKNTGNSFTDYLTILRIGFACKLLAECDMAITDICFEAGYANVSNFNRIFRNRRGMTPSAYRRLAQQRRTRRLDARPDTAHDALLQDVAAADSNAAARHA